MSNKVLKTESSEEFVYIEDHYTYDIDELIEELTAIKKEGFDTVDFDFEAPNSEYPIYSFKLRIKGYKETLETDEECKLRIEAENKQQKEAQEYYIALREESDKKEYARLKAKYGDKL